MRAIIILILPLETPLNILSVKLAAHAVRKQRAEVNDRAGNRTSQR